MRLHISLDDELVEALDARVGHRQRSAFIARAVCRALDDERRRELLEGSQQPEGLRMAGLVVDHWPVGE